MEHVTQCTVPMLAVLWVGTIRDSADIDSTATVKFITLGATVWDPVTALPSLRCTGIPCHCRGYDALWRALWADIPASSLCIYCMLFMNELG
jgi:hypothetical protein